MGSVAVPDWAVVTGISTASGTFNSPHENGGAYSGREDALLPCVSLEESSVSKQEHDVPKASPLASQGAFSKHMNQSRGRPSPIHAARELDLAEKGLAAQPAEPPKKGASLENDGKREPERSAHSAESARSKVPELTAIWTAAAGLKSSSSVDSSLGIRCCGFLHGNRSEPCPAACTRAWWGRLWQGMVTEWQKMSQAVRSKPAILLPGLLVMGLVVGLGVWAVVASANSDMSYRHESALKTAQDKALYIQTELDKTFMPAYVVSAMVQQSYRDYYPPQPPDLWDIYENKWYLVHPAFDKLSDELISLTRAGSVRTVSAIPHGVIRTMHPLNGTHNRDDRNWGAIGKNWLNDEANKAAVMTSLSTRNLTIIGPYNLTQGGIGIVGMQAIFVPGTRNNTFNIPPGPNNETGPVSDIPGIMELTYQPEHTAAPRFWGLTTVLISWDALRANVTRLPDLEDQGLEYVLTRPEGISGAELAVDWSGGVDPPRPPDYDMELEGPRPLRYFDLHQTLPDPVVVKVSLPNVQWTLYVTRSDGWVPSWRDPLIAMVCFASVILAVLVFAVLVSRTQQQRLFREVVEAAGQLAHTTRTLEEEKNRMQALLARHLDLIDLLEGGGQGAALAQAAGDACRSGGGAEGGGTRSKIDMLRQKMLLGGISYRRDQVGEAEQLTIKEMLGEGTFGKVYKGLWRGTEVAIKTIVLPANMSGKEKREKMAVMEAAISSSLAHPNIVQTYTYHIKPLRDSSATDRPMTLLSLTPGNTANAAHPNGSRSAAAGGALDTGAAQALAEQGAIVMGSPDSSVSTASAFFGIDSPEAGGGSESEAAAAAAAVANVGGGGNVVRPDSGGSHASVADRGVSMVEQGKGIHSYEVQLVLEYCDKGCLRDALDAGAFFGSEGLNYHAILDTAADVAKALLHLHLNNVLHGDLKATNVMLKSAGGDSGRGVVAKVADFGLSIRLDHAATHVSHTFQGSLTHMAPEVMLAGHVSRAADVYAFGITMWEIFTSGQPYKGTPGALLGHQTVKEGRRPVFPLGTPAAFQALAERCWHPEASQRPAFSEILDELLRIRSELPGPTPALQPFTPRPGPMPVSVGARSVGGGFQSGGGGSGGEQGGSGGGSLGFGGSLFGAGGSGNAAFVPLPKLSTGMPAGSRLLSLSGLVGANAAGRSLGSLGGTGLGLPGGLPTIEESNMEGGSRPLAILSADSGPLAAARGPGRGAAAGEGAGGGAADDGSGAGHEHVAVALRGSALGSVGVMLGGGDEGEDGQREVGLGRERAFFGKPHRD